MELELISYQLLCHLLFYVVEVTALDINGKLHILPRLSHLILFLITVKMRFNWKLVRIRVQSMKNQPAKNQIQKQTFVGGNLAPPYTTRLNAVARARRRPAAFSCVSSPTLFSSCLFLIFTLIKQKGPPEINQTFYYILPWKCTI